VKSIPQHKVIDLAIEEARTSARRFLYLDGALLLDSDAVPQEVFDLIDLTALSVSGGYGDARTGITVLPSAIGRMSNLKTLVLNKNRLSVLPKELFDLENLEELHIENNDLSVIPGDIERLKNLKRLSLSSNKLTSLPAQIGNLPHLQTLEIADNQISFLPLEIGTLTELLHISLGGNPITNVPLEILKQSSAAIINYCKSVFEESVTRLYEAKLLIVGEGGVGKTCILKRLIDNSFQVSATTTEGIDIHHWSFETDLTKSFLVNAWDFGGQEIYHATHQFFLTKRSLYIFVWTARNDETRFDYWLNIIKLLSDNAPVIVVLSKIDERIRMLDESLIQERFKNVIAFKRVSALTNAGMEDLADCIKTSIVGLDHIGNTLPKVWIDVRKELESLDVNCIDYDTYKAVCSKYRLDAAQADFLSRYYHDLGVVLHFQDHPILRQILFLKPEWATNAVYKLVDTKDIVKAYGRFRFDQLRRIWAEYPEDKHLYLVELMRKFELCFQIDETAEYIIPELLPPSSPSFGWSYADNLGFEYRYEFMPSGIMTRFIVINHHLIESDHYWKNGVVLKREGNRGLVVSDPFKKTIQVWINGTHKKDLLAIIRDKIDYIHRTLNSPSVREMVKCPCSECINKQESFFYDYATLRKFHSRGRTIVPCSNSAEDVSIELLLGGLKASAPKAEEEVLDILRYLKTKYDSEEEVLEQANKIVQLQPNFMGLGINLNELIKKLFAKDSRQKKARSAPAK
jgi:internalin A